MRRTVLAVTVSLALVACSGGDEPDDGAAAGDGGAGTTTTVDGPGPDATATTAAPPSGTEGEPGAGDDLPADGPRPARAGRYRYELAQEGQAPTETVLVVQEGDDGAPGVVQGHTFLFDGRRRIVRFGADGEVVESVEVVGDPRYAGANYVCDWEPDATAVPGGALEPGRTWSSETACTFSVEGQQVRHQVTERREVVGRRTVSIAGRDTEVVEIRRVTSLVATGGSDFTQEVTATDLYAPRLGLTVETDGTVVVETDEGRATGQVSLRLLDPEPSAG